MSLTIPFLRKPSPDFYFYVIAALDESGGIGKDGKIPWTLPDEMKYFRDVTRAHSRGRINAVVMGRNTWESLPDNFRPLPDRMNIVITSKPESLPLGITSFPSFDKALEFLRTYWVNSIDDIFVIGGAQLYATAVTRPECSSVFLSHVKGVYDCDTFFPRLDGCWIKVANEDKGGWTASVYSRRVK